MRPECGETNSPAGLSIQAPREEGSSAALRVARDAGRAHADLARSALLPELAATAVPAGVLRAGARVAVSHLRGMARDDALTAAPFLARRALTRDAVRSAHHAVAALGDGHARIRRDRATTAAATRRRRRRRRRLHGRRRAAPTRGRRDLLLDVIRDVADDDVHVRRLRRLGRARDPRAALGRTRTFDRRLLHRRGARDGDLLAGFSAPRRVRGTNAAVALRDRAARATLTLVRDPRRVRGTHAAVALHHRSAGAHEAAIGRDDVARGVGVGRRRIGGRRGRVRGRDVVRLTRATIAITMAVTRRGDEADQTKRDEEEHARAHGRSLAPGHIPRSVWTNA